MQLTDRMFEPRLAQTERTLGHAHETRELDLIRAPVRRALVAAAGWGGKSLVDFLVLRRLSYHFGHPEWLRWYLPTQLLYPVYLVAVGTVALLRPRVVWKGRGG